MQPVVTNLPILSYTAALATEQDRDRVISYSSPGDSRLYFILHSTTTDISPPADRAFAQQCAAT